MHLHRGNLFLVGMPGSGKSTLGRLLAKRLGKAFYDADSELERRLGVSIPVIFELEGEPGFRDREAGDHRRVRAAHPHDIRDRRRRGAARRSIATA